MILDDVPKSRWYLWIELLFSPLTAWKSILNRKPYTDYMFWLILLISCGLGSVTGAMHPQVGVFNQPIKAVIVLCGIFVLGFLCLYLAVILLGVLAKWLGKLLGGSGSYQKMQAVLVWSGIPYLYAMTFWLIVVLLEGKAGMGVYVYDAGNHTFGYLMLPWLTVLVGLGFAEAHGISIKRGLLISVIVYLLPSLLLYDLF